MAQRRERTDPQIQRLLGQLHHLGWPASKASSIPLESTRRRFADMAVSILAMPDGQPLSIVAVSDALPPRAEAFTAYEDLADIHREVQARLRDSRIVGRYAVLLDRSGRANLVDFQHEEVLIETSGEKELEERLLPTLEIGVLARGSLASLRRKTPRQRAQELADFTAHWAIRIGAAIGTTPESMMPFLHGLHLARLAESLGFVELRPCPFARFNLGAKTPSPTTLLGSMVKPLVLPLHFLQGEVGDAIREMPKRLSRESVLTDFLTSYARLARSKFSADLFAEAFADEELRRTSWRAGVVGEGLPELSLGAEYWLAEAWEVDFDHVGYAVLLQGFDALAEFLRQHAQQLLALEAQGRSTGTQLDLLRPAPPRVAEDDAPRFVLQNIIHVQTERRSRALLARTILQARMAEWNARLRRDDLVFPVPRVMHFEPPTPTPPPPRRDPALN